MESVLDSVRSWRDLTAGLLPRVASAAQVEAKRLAHSSQVLPAARLPRPLSEEKTRIHLHPPPLRLCTLNRTRVQASSATEISRSLRKAAEKLSTRSDALLAMVEEMREIAAAVGAEEQNAKEKMKTDKP